MITENWVRFFCLLVLGIASIRDTVVRDHVDAGDTQSDYFKVT